MSASRSKLSMHRELKSDCIQVMAFLLWHTSTQWVLLVPIRQTAMLCMKDQALLKVDCQSAIDQSPE